MKKYNRILLGAAGLHRPIDQAPHKGKHPQRGPRRDNKLATLGHITRTTELGHEVLVAHEWWRTSKTTRLATVVLSPSLPLSLSLCLHPSLSLCIKKTMRVYMYIYVYVYIYI